jgi:hypothetical protein
MSEFENNERFERPENVTFFLEFYYNDKDEESEINKVYQKLCIYGYKGVLDQCTIEIKDRKFEVRLF